MSDEDIRAAIKYALSYDPNHRSYFASSIGAICNRFDESFVQQQLIPFLTNWYDHNNPPEGRAISSQLYYIAQKSSSCLLLAPLIKALLIAEDHETTHNVLVFLAHSNSNPGFLDLLQNLAKTKYDCVRMFISDLLIYIISPEDCSSMVSSLCSDPSFAVRLSVIKNVPKFKPDLAEFVIDILLHDAQGKIRQMIPAATVGFDLFALKVLPALKGDYEWSVRAAAATKSCEFSKPEYIFNYVIELYNDGTWEVKYAALRSLTNIFKKHKETRFPEYEVYISKLVTYEFPQLVHSVIGKQAISMVVELVKREQIQPGSDEYNIVVSTLLELRTPKMWSHLFKIIFDVKNELLAPFLSNCYKKVVDKIKSAINWRERAALFDVFTKLINLFQNDEIRNELIGIAKDLCHDSAFPVREKASQFIVQQYINERNAIFEFAEELKKSETFRDRQVSIIVLHELLKVTTDDSLRAPIIAQIESFKEDKFENVRTLAISSLS